MSHKVIVELDERAEQIIRKIAEHDKVSVPRAATELFCDYMGKLEKLMPAIEADAENKPTIYISGPISDDPDYKAKFAKAHQVLEECGFDVLDPTELVKVSSEKDYTDYLSEALWHMLKADQLYMLKGWSTSTGAKLELKLAKLLGKKIRYE